MRKHTWIILGVIFGGFLLFYILFTNVLFPLFEYTVFPMSRPINNEARYYIHEDEQLSAQYGQVDTVNIVEGVSFPETDTIAKRQYEVYTTDYRLIVWVSVEKIDGEWTVRAMEIVEAHPLSIEKE